MIASQLKKAGKQVFVSMNKSFGESAGGETRPAFYDIDKTCPALRLLDQNYFVIRSEMESVLPYQNHIPRYHDIARHETYISGTIDPDKNWRVFMLHSNLGDPKDNQAKCPKTTALIAQIPNVYQAFFSILDPGKSIPAHNGDYLGYLRYHLGLKVPVHNPPSIRVKDQTYIWQENQSILFDDSWNHEVYNQSDDIRVVLIVDILRPMPLHLHAMNWAITKILMRQSEESKLVMANIKKYSLMDTTN
jgi:aspartyl/asparaginyl beta-hydroxylase (cupin superfamily)